MHLSVRRPHDVPGGLVLEVLNLTRRSRRHEEQPARYVGDQVTLKNISRRYHSTVNCHVKLLMYGSILFVRASPLAFDEKLLALS